MSKNSKPNKKRIIGMVTSSLIFAGATAGAIFGLTKYSTDSDTFKKSPEIQDHYQIQVDVD
jgi:hypothetical protein